LIGENLNLTVRFDNTSSTVTDTGFGPYIDLYIPTTGIDGADAAADDGIDFLGATYLGSNVTATVLTLTASGVNHPYAVNTDGSPVVITPPTGFRAGDKLVVLQLPFGSFTVDQPAADISVSLSLSNQADLNQPLTLRTQGGFQYGGDALANPATDPSIIGTAASASVNPSLFRLTKTYVGPEDETATGPNFPRQYRITVDVANGQTITNLDLTDILPSNMQFVSVDSTTINGSNASATSVATPSTSNPGGTLTRRLASVTGTAGTNDAEMIFTYFIPLDDASSAAVINASTGDDATSVNDAQASGTWDPLDTRDPTITATSNVTANDHTLTPKSIAIQKSATIVGGGGRTNIVPGDVVEYTLNFQISDFFAFQNLVATDIFTDGQLFDSTFNPTLSIFENGVSSPFSFTLNTDYTVVRNADNNPATPLTDGSTTVVFSISSLLNAASYSVNGRLLGGLVVDGGAANDGATTGTIVFRTVIQDEYTDTYQSGEPALNPRDIVDNDVTISGDLLDTTTLVANGNSEADTSGASLQVAEGVLAKSIYAINGNTSFTSPFFVRPGDTVTYRIRYTIPSGDIENLTLTDFLPLPIFDSSEVASFSTTISAAPPAAGTAKFGPSETFFGVSGLTPTLSQPGGNSVRFNIGTFSDTANLQREVDILFTVTVSDEPFADGLFLTNQVRSSENNTELVGQNEDAIIQLELAEPDVSIHKGVLGHNTTGFTLGGIVFTNPTVAANFTGTIDTAAEVSAIDNSNLTSNQVDAGDSVRFGIVAINEGGLGAFDVSITDAVVAGYVVPANLAAMNLVVRRGDGTLLTLGVDYTASLVGANLAISLTDTGGNPALAAGRDVNDNRTTDGSNVVLISYDLVLASNVEAGRDLINTATLTNFAGTEGGPDHTTLNPTSQATVRTAGATITKTILSTNQAHTTGNNVAIGETAQYQVVIRVAEGTSTGVTLVDTLPAGLAFVSLDSISASAALATSIAGGFNSVLSSGVIAAVGTGAANAGRSATFNFGNITNSNTVNSTDETITLRYTVVAINGGSNDAGDTRANSAVWTSDDDTASGNAPNLTIVEPTITVSKSVNSTSADAGGTVTFTVTVTNSSTTDAFNVSFSDPIPAKLQYVAGSFARTAGVVPTSTSDSSGLSATWATLAAGASTTFTYQATLRSTVVPAEVITNTASSTWTSLPGDVTTPITTNNSLSTERTGSTSNPGGTDNDYTASNTSTITVVDANTSKSVIATSESATTGSSVAIGEIVRYRLIARVPEPTITNFQFVDNLPVGMQFLNDGSARVAFVSNNGISSSVSSLAGAGLAVVGDQSTLASITPTFVVPTAQITGGPFNSGTDVTFNLGTLTNADSDLNSEFVVLEFNAIVRNESGNVSGTSLANTVQVLAGGSLVGTSTPSTDVTVVEPQITNVAKTVTPAVGNTVTYVVTFSNTGTATAFNTRLLDVVPTGTTLDLSSVSVTLGGGATGSTTSSSTSSQLDVTIDSIPVGGTVRVQYRVTVASPGSTLTNTANVTYTSLTASGTTLAGSNQGAAGTSTGERTGTGGGVNTYSDADTLSLGSISNLVWMNFNGNGTQDAGEPGLAGVQVTLLYAGANGTFGDSDDVTLNTTTDSTGQYLFSGLPAGNYRVSIPTPPPGTAVNFDLDGSTLTLGTAGTTLTAGQVRTDVDFGLVGTGSIGDFLWRDLDGDGTVDSGETGIANVTVNLRWAGLDGVFGNADDFTLTTVTDGSGGYSFANIPAGQYRISVDTADSDIPAGFFPGFDLDGGFNASTTTSLTNGQNRTDVDFGFTQVTTITGRVYDDRNNDGIFNAGDVGIPNVDVTLRDSNNQNVTATTDANGIYTFNNVRPGTYQLIETQPGGFLDKDETAGNLGGNTSVNDTISNIVVNGNPGTGYNFGEVRPSSIAGSSFVDSNNDGVRGNNERGIPGVVVRLTGTDDRNQSVSANVTTDGNGNYIFTGMRPGTYRLAQTQPTQFVDGRDTAGSNGGSTATNDVISNIVIQGGQNPTTYVFGERGLAAVFANKRSLLGRNNITFSNLGLVAGSGTSTVNTVAANIAAAASPANTSSANAVKSNASSAPASTSSTSSATPTKASSTASSHINILKRLLSRFRSR
jgi:uncharacterized repeat protein (TIGR01451 family)/fimbrial isopeptide formation D2 family protein